MSLQAGQQYQMYGIFMESMFCKQKYHMKLNQLAEILGILSLKIQNPSKDITLNHQLPNL
jgi:hypothetical protein